jgi:hypothetical protein
MVFLSGNESVQVFYHYICIAIRDSIIKRRRVDIPLNSLILPHFCACPKPVPGFPMSYISWFFLMFYDLR